MKRRITDLFKKMFRGRKSVKPELNETNVPTIEKTDMFQHRKKSPSRWITRHNQVQAQQANALRKRRKKNKVASKQRKLNSINS